MLRLYEGAAFRISISSKDVEKREMVKPDEPNDPENTKDIVMTPGGPRAKERVREMRPSEALRRTEEGTYVVVPQEKPTQGARASRIPKGMAITPGGIRDKSRVHLVEPNHMLDGTGGHLRKLHRDGQVVRTRWVRSSPMAT